MSAHETNSSNSNSGLAFIVGALVVAVAVLGWAFFSGAEEGAADLLTVATYAVLEGMSPSGALRALTSDTAAMFAIGDRVGRIATGLDADLLLLDGEPLSPATSVLRAWVAGEEVQG